MIKKTVTKIQIILIIMITFIIVINSSSLAANNYTCKVNISGESNQIERGKTLNLEFSISNINAGGGIAAMSTILDYDSEVFDVEVETVNGWTQLSEGDVINFFAPNYEAVNQDSHIANIKVTAKNTAKTEEQLIKFVQNEISSEGKTYPVAPAVKRITVVTKINNGDTGTTNQVTDNINKVEEEKEKEQEKEQKPNMSGLPLPSAGIVGNTLVIAIIVAVIIAVIRYRKYKKLD